VSWEGVIQKYFAKAEHRIHSDFVGQIFPAYAIPGLLGISEQLTLQAAR
jgi:hypothetical protein